MTPFRTDEPLWYNVGVWGQMGYAVPNFGDNPTSLNNGVAELVDMIGRNLSAIMHHEDAWLRVPPSINTLTRVHKLVVRARAIVGSRAVPPSKPNMEAVHSTPSPEDFLVYPVPFFKVRNRWLKSWCGLTLASLTEAMQHTENVKAFEFSTTFGGLVGQYLDRIYRMMSIELFGVPAATVDAAATGGASFTLTDALLGSYDPTKFFTQTELIDVTPPDFPLPTEDDLEVLTNGIPATKLAGLQRYPSSNDPFTGVPTPATPTLGGTGSTAATGNSFPPPPGP